MDQQTNPHELYTTANIRYALIHSNVPGVLALVPNEPICVPASDWEACLKKITELTSSNWVGIRETHGDGTRVIYSKTFRCHRAGSYVPQRSVRTGQKKSKKVNCPGSLKITIWAHQPLECEITLLRDHDFHRPGDYRDRRTLKLTKSTIETIREQLRDGRNCREIRMALLRQFELVPDNSNAGHRKVSYHDVYNQLNKVRFKTCCNVK